MHDLRPIVIASSLAFSLINFRGQLIASLISSGRRVIACAPDRDEKAIAGLKAMGAEFRLIPMARTGLNPFEDLRSLIAYWRLFRAVRPELVLAYTQKPIIYAGLALRLLRGVRFYPMVTGLGYVFTEANRRFWLQRLLSWLYRAATRRAARLIVFNSDDGAELLRRRIVRDPAMIVHVPGSGIDLERFAEAPLPPSPPVFLVVARLLIDKGLREYAAAARIVRETFPLARFQLLGPPDANPAAIPFAEVRAWHQEGIIEYLGETRDVRPWLAGCTVYVLPSYREGLPRTVLEGMATARAIVTTDVPGCRDTVIDGDNGYLVPPQDPEALAAALIRFCANPELARRMGQRSRAMAQHFSVDRVNHLLLETLALEPPTEVSAPIAEAGHFAIS